jgi:outer membrane protein assembly factor BamB
MLLCFDKKSGKQLWEAGTTWSKPELTHATNPYCSGSPATDGEHVIVSFASAGVYCYDMKGKELWKRTDLGEQKHIWGYGTSPVIAGDRVFLNFGPGENTVLHCFDKKTGKTPGSTTSLVARLVRAVASSGSEAGATRSCARWAAAMSSS